MVCLSSFYDKSFPDSYACKHVVVLLTKKSTYSIDVQFLPKVHSEMMLLSLVKPSLTESIVCHSFTPQFAITKYLLPNLYLSKSTLDRNDNQLQGWQAVQCVFYLNLQNFKFTPLHIAHSPRQPSLYYTHVHQPLPCSSILFLKNVSLISFLVFWLEFSKSVRELNCVLKFCFLFFGGAFRALKQ